eukprot:gb/GECG01011284.1/.p1 GENE.gb/GECG01011284.1/~~gb/GECG01011284.1/.p1  ORF type:complete len:287 (+),score=42.12 gb/GECG01011284.1/:1-861(+)
MSAMDEDPMAMLRKLFDRSPEEDIDEVSLSSDDEKDPSTMCPFSRAVREFIRECRTKLATRDAKIYKLNIKQLENALRDQGILESETVFDHLSDTIVDFLNFRLVVKFCKITKKQLKQAATVLKNFGNFLLRRNYVSQVEGLTIVEMAQRAHHDLPGCEELYNAIAEFAPNENGVHARDTTTANMFSGKSFKFPPSKRINMWGQKPKKGEKMGLYYIRKIGEGILHLRNTQDERDNIKVNVPARIAQKAAYDWTLDAEFVKDGANWKISEIYCVYPAPLTCTVYSM